jgi:hypothetical protein
MLIIYYFVPRPDHAKGYLELTNNVPYKRKQDAITMQVMYTDVQCTRNFYNVSAAYLPLKPPNPLKPRKE